MVLQSLLTSTSSQICTWVAEEKTLLTPKHSWNAFSEPRPTNIFLYAGGQRPWFLCLWGIVYYAGYRGQRIREYTVMGALCSTGSLIEIQQDCFFRDNAGRTFPIINYNC